MLLGMPWERALVSIDWPRDREGFPRRSRGLLVYLFGLATFAALVGSALAGSARSAGVLGGGPGRLRVRVGSPLGRVLWGAWKVSLLRDLVVGSLMGRVAWHFIDAGLAALQVFGGHFVNRALTGLLPRRLFFFLAMSHGNPSDQGN